MDMVFNVGHGHTDRLHISMDGWIDGQTDRWIDGPWIDELDSIGT